MIRGDRGQKVFTQWKHVLAELSIVWKNATDPVGGGGRLRVAGTRKEGGWGGMARLGLIRGGMGDNEGNMDFRKNPMR